jgi:hypothetical protein
MPLACGFFVLQLLIIIKPSLSNALMKHWLKMKLQSLPTNHSCQRLLKRGLISENLEKAPTNLFLLLCKPDKFFSLKFVHQLRRQHSSYTALQLLAALPLKKSLQSVIIAGLDAT